MSLVRVSVKNYRALRRAAWDIPEGMSVVVGPNGSGKTTLLGVLPLLGNIDRYGPQKALSEIGGAAFIRSVGADTEVQLGIAVDDLRWTFEPQFDRGSVAHDGRETLFSGDTEVVTRPAGDASALYRGLLMPTRAMLAVRAARDREPDDTDLRRLADAMLSCTHYESLRFGVLGLGDNGSKANGDLALDRNALNAFSVLRNWNNQREHRARHQFVLDALRVIFPEELDDFDFETAGQTVFLRTYHARFGPQAMTYADVSAGLKYAMLQLMGVASTPERGVVALDEPETALHPEAIRRLLSEIATYAVKNQLRVVFATHSPVVLDHFRGEPERVFVMQPGQAKQPVRLDELHDTEWLRQFSLGDLYMANDFGAPKAAE